MNLVEKLLTAMNEELPIQYTDEYSICEVEITRKPINLSDGDGMQVPCKLKLTGRSKFVNILQNSLKTKN